jgi:hypothetical protein
MPTARVHDIDIWYERSGGDGPVPIGELARLVEAGDPIAGGGVEAHHLSQLNLR